MTIVSGIATFWPPLLLFGRHPVVHALLISSYALENVVSSFSSLLSEKLGHGIRSL